MVLLCDLVEIDEAAPCQRNQEPDLGTPFATARDRFADFDKFRATASSFRKDAVRCVGIKR